MEPMLDCRAVMQQLWDHLDGELTAERAAQIDAHLAKCSHCHPLFDFERQFQRAVAATRPEHPDVERLSRRLHWLLKEAGFVAPENAR
jgi:anti-sigma factor (TIGR02949 family)